MTSTHEGDLDVPVELRGSPIVLSGRYVELRPMVPNDLPLAHELEIAGPNAPLYRFRGVTLGHEALNEAVWRNVMVQFVAWTRMPQPQAIGIVAVMSPDLRNGYAHFRGAMLPSVHRQPYVLEAFQLMLDYVFRVFPIRKLYAEVLEPNFESFASAVGKVFSVEGRLVAHEYYDGGYVDQLFLAIHRDVYFSYRETLGGDLQQLISDAERDRPADSAL